MCRAFGPPESLVVDEVDDPRPGQGEVLVDVRACAVNFPDVLMIQDLYQFKPGLPFVPGGEVAGVVHEVGGGVEGVQVGDRVLASGNTGGLAERFVAPVTSLVPIPDGIDFPPASALLYAYGTSQYALVERAHLQPGETLLVLGAAGGVGLAAVELGALLGATVIAAASNEEKLALCRQYGAAHTIDYEREDLKARVRALTDGRGVDVVYDAVGGRHAEPALRSTAWDGRYLVIGFATGDIPRIPLNLPLLKSCSIIGVFWGAFVAREPARSRANLDQLVEWWTKGELHPHVSATYPLADAGQALRDIADRRALGKVVVTI